MPRRASPYDAALLRAIGRQITAHREKNDILIPKLAKAGDMLPKAIIGIENGTNREAHSYHHRARGFAMLGAPFAVNLHGAHEEAVAALQNTPVPTTVPTNPTKGQS